MYAQNRITGKILYFTLDVNSICLSRLRSLRYCFHLPVEQKWAMSRANARMHRPRRMVSSMAVISNIMCQQAGLAVVVSVASVGGLERWSRRRARMSASIAEDWAMASRSRSRRT